MPGILVTLRGADGRITLDDQGAQVTYVRLIGHGAQADWSAPQTEQIVPAGTVAGMEAGIRDLIVGLETGRATAGPAEDAWRSAAILDAVLRSQVNGNAPARIQKPKWEE